MSGLFALLDDVATIAKLAAASLDDVAAATGKASAKAAGVVVDDTAVTPQYLQGLRPDQELPIIKRIALGSLRNKILVILPAALILSYFLPSLLPPLMLLGGSYLAFEGMEKVAHHFQHRSHSQKHGSVSSPSAFLAEAPTAFPNSTPVSPDNSPAASDSAPDAIESDLPAATDSEKADQVVKNAVRTDLILSAEIMVIALNEIATIGLFSRAIVLIIVAFLITFLVYGVVAVLVKLDDLGLALARRKNVAGQSLGKALVAAMPKLLRIIGVIGTFAMIWVGGHILLSSSADLGWEAPHHLVNHLVEGTAQSLSGWGSPTSFVQVLGQVLASPTATVLETAISLVVGSIWGGLLVLISGLVGRLRR